MIQRLLRFKHKKSFDRGFTTLEVLVSIIIALAFVSVAMQSFVLAMAMKVQAQEKQRANQLIQEDLEAVNNLASNVAEDHDNKCNPVATTSPTRTAYENSYAYELWEDIDAVTAPTVNLLIASDGTTSGKRLGLIRNQINDLSDPSPVEDAPYRTLKINYQVRELDSSDNPIGDVIAKRYVEVIPDVALQCP
ncbi:type II secretion system protein [Pleurocapsales cyanobacterium LEGE 10410]|nr:type II secretion system protein [Pleurocapsales cyanobacterium LEGE 10410]